MSFLFTLFLSRKGGRAEARKGRAEVLGPSGGGSGSVGEGGGSWVEDSLHFEARRAEVEQEAHSLVGRSQVTGQDREVDVLESGDRLELHDQGVLDEKVQAVRPDLDPSKSDRNGELLLEGDPPSMEFHDQGPLVDGLDEPRTELPVNRNSGSQHGPRKQRPFHRPPQTKTTQPFRPSALPPFRERKEQTRCSKRNQQGFTLLECLIALLLVSTALIIVVESQAFAINQEAKANNLNAASLLARDVMVDLEIRMQKEGFGEIEVRESGTFTDQRYDNHYEEWRWEYEVEKVDLEIPNLSNLMGMAEGAVADGDAPQNDLLAMESMGIDLSFFGDYMGKFLREARVRVCWPDGLGADGLPSEDCIELNTHLVNPTGRVLTEEQMQALEGAGVGEF